jgi:hypothetical protein
MRVVVQQVAQHQHSAFQPRQAAQRRHIGFHHIIAITGLPRGRFIALHGVHFDIRGDQVIATMGFSPSGVYEVLDVKTFAHQAALHVDRGDHNGVDLARGGGVF